MSVQGDHKLDRHRWMAIRGAVGGLVSGLIFGVAQMWYLADAGLPADTIIHMVATIVQPDELFYSGETSALVGWAVHIALSISYGVILGLIASELRSNVTRVAFALIHGAGIFMFNFLVLAPAFYPVFESANLPFEATSHVMFGALIAPFVLLWRGRVKEEPPLPPIVEQWRAKGAPVDNAPAASGPAWEPLNLR